MKNILLLATLLFMSAAINAQDVLGKWKTIDDETGKPKSIVELYMVGDKLHGKILKLFREEGEDPDPICDECSDDRKDQKVIGMEIIRDMEVDGSEWNDGTICDPKNGKVYDCKLWVDEEDNKVLNVRGYIAFFYRTQYWQRAD